MRDPKTHAKVLGRRMSAVQKAWGAERSAHAFKPSRLWRLFKRVTEVTNRHEDTTGWAYYPPEGSTPGKWVYTEIDTEETPDA